MASIKKLRKIAVEGLDSDNRALGALTEAASPDFAIRSALYELSLARQNPGSVRHHMDRVRLLMIVGINSCPDIHIPDISSFKEQTGGQSGQAGQ